ncbi:MAG: hypothetical protein ACKVII_19315, partial [Planctomycetales bacterium]
ILAKVNERSHKTITLHVQLLLSDDREGRLRALDYFYQPKLIFHQGYIHLDRFFYVLNELSRLGLRDEQVLYPESVELMYKIMMTDDVHYGRFEGETVCEIVKRTLSPLQGKIEEMISQHPQPTVIDAVSVNYWLSRPVSDWAWNMSGVDNSMIDKCQELRRQNRGGPTERRLSAPIG